MFFLIALRLLEKFSLLRRATPRNNEKGNSQTSLCEVKFVFMEIISHG
jgi:hypothetical protein